MIEEETKLLCAMNEEQLKALVEHGAYTQLKIMKVLKPWVYPNAIDELDIEDYKDAIAKIIKIIYFDEDFQ